MGGHAGFVSALATSASLIFSILAILLTSVAPASTSEGCPNEARREEQGAAGRALPDCRAYELVSNPSQPSPTYPLLETSTQFPPLETIQLVPSGAASDEEPAFLPGVPGGVSIALDGNAALFSSYEPNSDSDSSASNLSRRGSDGWTGENIIPPISRHITCNVTGYVGFSPNLEQVAVNIGAAESSTTYTVEDCGHAEPHVVPGESEESSNLLLRDTATHSFQLVNVTPPGVKSYDFFFGAVLGVEACCCFF